MDTTSSANISGSPKEMKLEISRMLGQIGELQEQIKADSAAIARIDAEYAVLKAEGVALQEETKQILANLRSIL